MQFSTVFFRYVTFASSLDLLTDWLFSYKYGVSSELAIRNSQFYGTQSIWTQSQTNGGVLSDLQTINLERQHCTLDISQYMRQMSRVFTINIHAPRLMNPMDFKNPKTFPLSQTIRKIINVSIIPFHSYCGVQLPWQNVMSKRLHLSSLHCSTFPDGK